MLQDDTYLFTPGFQDPMEENEVVRDLGIMIDADASFKTHRLKAPKKTMNKCSWLLRTLRSRDPQLMKTLWWTLAQPHFDYGSQLWSPVERTGEIPWQEKPQRVYTKKIFPKYLSQKLSQKIH